MYSEVVPSWLTCLAPPLPIWGKKFIIIIIIEKPYEVTRGPTVGSRNYEVRPSVPEKLRSDCQFPNF